MRVLPIPNSIAEVASFKTEFLENQTENASDCRLHTEMLQQWGELASEEANIGWPSGASLLPLCVCLLTR